MSRRFRVTANFPILREHGHQTVIVEGSNWMVAIGKAARAFKRLDVMHRRRITSLSMTVEQMEGPVNEPNLDQPETGNQQSLPVPASEETVMNDHVPVPVSEPQEIVDDYEEANAEAERLINEGVEVDPEGEGD